MQFRFATISLVNATKTHRLMKQKCVGSLLAGEIAEAPDFTNADNQDWIPLIRSSS
jgi:hypothetical protein